MKLTFEIELPVSGDALAAALDELDFFRALIAPGAQRLATAGGSDPDLDLDVDLDELDENARQAPAKPQPKKVKAKAPAAKPQPKKAPAAKAPESNVISVADARIIASKVGRLDNGPAILRELLSDFDAERLSAIPETERENFVARCQELLDG